MNSPQNLAQALARAKQARENYIAAEKSDPFCRARVMLHESNGIVDFTHGYSADVEYETRQTPLGENYSAPIYLSRARP